MPKKPKYHIQPSWVNPEWFIVAQISNNAIIAHVPEEGIAVLITDYLNGLPGKQQPKRKQVAIYPTLKKKSNSE